MSEIVNENENELQGVEVDDLFGIEAEVNSVFANRPSADPEQLDATQTQSDAETGLIEKDFEMPNGEIVTIEGPNEAAIYELAMTEQRRILEAQRLFSDDDEDEDIPEPQTYEPIPEATPDDMAAILLGLNKNPVEALTRALEFGLGMPRDRLKKLDQALTIAEHQSYGQTITQKFLNKHLQRNEYGEVVGGDYYPTPENRDMLIKYIQKKGWKPSVKSLNDAYQDIKQHLRPFPDDFFDSSNNASNEEDDAPTALSSSMNTHRSATGQSAEADLRQKVAAMSDEEFEAWANRLKG